MPSTPDPPRPRSLLPRRVVWRGVAVAAVAILVVRLTYFLFLDVVDERAGHVAERVFNEITGSVLALLPLGATAWLARRVPLVRPLRPYTAATYVAAFVVLSSLHTAAMVATRAALAPALGLRGYAYAFPPSRFAYEGANDVIVYVACLALLALAESVLAQRERERHARALEGSLLRAELSNLRLQLQPHFLFNALNTISSTMYDDVAAADAQLGHLADLLRTSLRTTHTHEVPAHDELRLLGQYLALMHARFGDALAVTIDAPDEVHALLVPSMVLQPLVENAVRHGGVSRVGHGCVAVTLRREGETLEIRVRDATVSGVGTRDSVVGTLSHPITEPRVPTPGVSGTGLTATARRLRLLYGDAQAMHAGPVDGGWEVVLRIPARTAAAAPDALVPA